MCSYVITCVVSFSFSLYHMYALIRLIFMCVRIGTNLLCGAFFSRGLWGLVAMLASSASQLVLGEQLSSWWDTPAPTWNNPGDLWSSSTSCSSGMSSWEKSTIIFRINMWKSSVCLNVECDFSLVYDITKIHVAPRWGRQVLGALEWIKGLVHSCYTQLFRLSSFLKSGCRSVYSASIIIFCNISWF